MNNKVKKRKHICSQAPDPLLMDTLKDAIEAGDKLAEAAHRIQADHDGVHRLRLALANWYTARANEFGRGDKVRPLNNKVER